MNKEIDNTRRMFFLYVLLVSFEHYLPTERKNGYIHGDKQREEKKELICFDDLLFVHTEK
jgi:hypothetical protein